MSTLKLIAIYLCNLMYYVNKRLEYEPNGRRWSNAVDIDRFFKRSIVIYEITNKCLFSY